MFRPHCGHLKANIYRLSAFNVRTIWDPIVRTLVLEYGTYLTCYQSDGIWDPILYAQ